MQEPKIRFIHLRRPDGTGTTIAFRPLSDNAIEVTIAHCNPKDNYNRKIGRDITSGRMRKLKFDAIIHYTLGNKPTVAKILKTLHLRKLIDLDEYLVHIVEKKFLPTLKKPFIFPSTEIDFCATENQKEERS